MSDGWIGVDLDGTLAFYDVWRGADHVGEPIVQMVEFVRTLIRDGKTVKIFTARVSEDPHDEARKAIQEWCRTHIGCVLPVTCVKDYGCVVLYDDRCRQVEFNTGRIIEL